MTDFTEADRTRGRKDDSVSRRAGLMDIIRKLGIHKDIPKGATNEQLQMFIDNIQKKRKIDADKKNLRYPDDTERGIQKRGKKPEGVGKYRPIEEYNLASGGNVINKKKYANGGGVRKTKLLDY